MASSRFVFSDLVRSLKEFHQGFLFYQVQCFDKVAYLGQKGSQNGKSQQEKDGIDHTVTCLNNNRCQEVVTKANLKQKKEATV
jgi:hypothetical protein